MTKRVSRSELTREAPQGIKEPWPKMPASPAGRQTSQGRGIIPLLKFYLCLASGFFHACGGGLIHALLVIAAVVFIFQGQRQYLWRAIDQDGDVIDILVQPRRDQRAAERFFRKLLKGREREPQRLVTDQLRSYEAGLRTIMPSVQHNTERYANNRAEVSHEPIRQRERQLRGFKSVAQAQRFWSVQGVIHLFRVGRTCCGQPTTGCCEAVPSLFGIR